ncbi:MAG: hypothetical protein JW731_07345 [Bacteroidales bacterium]|nr:hypothetical protein [Bacteroidales bacterium]
MSGKNTSKRKKVLAIILIAGLLVFIVILAGINLYIERMASEKIVTQLNKPGSLYTLAIDDIDVHIFRGNITLRNIHFIPTDSARSILAAGGIKALPQAQIGEFKITGINLIKFLRKKNISIKKIVIDDINLEYTVNKNAQTGKKKPFSLQNVLADKIHSANIGRLDLQNVTFRLMDYQNDSLPDFEIDSVFLGIQDIHLDQNTLVNPFPVTLSEIKLNTGHFELNTLAYYNIKTDDIRFNLTDSTVTVDGFKLKPKFSKKAYNKLIKFNNDWFDIVAGRIVFNRINMHELEFSKMITILSVSIESPDIKIYRDKNLPDAPFKYKPLLAGLLKKIPYPVTIDTLMIKNGKLIYEELAANGELPGSVFFDPLFITAYNITNHTDVIRQKPHMEIDFNGKIMGEANLDANLKIDLVNDNELFFTQGKLSPIRGTAFNPMVENMLNVSIKDGDIHSAEFRFRATDDISDGEMTLIYENIKVEVMKHKDTGKESKVVSFVANELVNKRNLPDDNRYRTGTIYFERRKDKGLVNFLWNSSKSGIISILAPIADKTEKEKRKAEKAEGEREKSKKEKKSKN